MFTRGWIYLYMSCRNGREVCCSGYRVNQTSGNCDSMSRYYILILLSLWVKMNKIKAKFYFLKKIPLSFMLLNEYVIEFTNETQHHSQNQ